MAVLSIATTSLPALRHRREDIPALLDHFLAEARRKHAGSPARGLSSEALRRLIDYAWPGNVRELAHVVERAVLLAQGPDIDVADLVGLDDRRAPELTGDIVPMIEMQRRYARWALDRMNGHKTRTAERLDVDVKTLNRWLSDD